MLWYNNDNTVTIEPLIFYIHTTSNEYCHHLLLVSMSLSTCATIVSSLFQFIYANVILLNPL